MEDSEGLARIALGLSERWIPLRPWAIAGLGAAGIGLTKVLADKLVNFIDPARKNGEANTSILGILLQGGFTPVGASIGIADTDPATLAFGNRELAMLAHKLIAPFRSLKVPTPTTAGQQAHRLYETIVANRNGELDALAEWRREMFKSLFESLKVERIDLVVNLRSLPGTGGALDALLRERIDPAILMNPAWHVTVSVRPDITKLSDPIKYSESITWAIEKEKTLMEQGNLDTIIIVTNEATPAVKAALRDKGVFARLAQAAQDLRRAVLDPYTATRYLTTQAALARMPAPEANDLIVRAIEPLLIGVTAGYLVGRELVMAQGGPTDAYNLKLQLMKRWVTPAYLPEDHALDLKDALEKMMVLTLAPHEIWNADRVVMVIGSETAKKLHLEGPALANTIQDVLYRYGYLGRVVTLTFNGERGYWLYIAHSDPPRLYSLEPIIEALRRGRG